MPISSIILKAVRGQEVHQIFHTIVTPASSTIFCAHEDVLTERMKYLQRNVSSVTSLLLHPNKQ